jgi:hypothetical protein
MEILKLLDTAGEAATEHEGKRRQSPQSPGTAIAAKHSNRQAPQSPPGTTRCIDGLR